MNAESYVIEGLKKRNSELEEKLRIEKECGMGVKHSIVDTIGGLVEGEPTNTDNYLQRIRELVQKEKYLKAID